MNERQIVLGTALLIKAAGGLEEASSACKSLARPYSIQQLSRCQTLGSGCFLPVDIMGALESYVGRPILSQMFVEARPAGDAGSLVADLLEETTDAVALQTALGKVALGGKLTAAECTAARRLHAKLTEVVQRVGADLDRSGCPSS